MTFLRFLSGAGKLILKGNKTYYAWCAFLLALIGAGAAAYVHQMQTGLIVTHMRDSVSWAYYIGNFTFLVGVAAAAIMLVIPAYIYHWQPIKELVILGELLAISACIMCLMFVTVDMGHPERFWHLIPFIGALNFPRALLAWDVLVLNLYLALNLTIVGYLLYSAFVDRPPNQSFVWPLVIFSIPFAVSIHTVTAFIYNGMVARPYWNASILAPKFLASAFCSGPAVLLILLQVLRRTTRLKIQDAAIWKIAELMAYAMAVNLFLDRRGDLQGVLLRQRAHGLHEVLLHRHRRPPGDCAVRLDVAHLRLRRLPAVPDPAGEKERPAAQRRLRAHLRGRVHRKGDRPADPRLHAGHPRRNLRVHPVVHRNPRQRRNLLRRVPDLHPHAESRGPGDARRIQAEPTEPRTMIHHEPSLHWIGGYQ